MQRVLDERRGAAYQRPPCDFERVECPRSACLTMEENCTTAMATLNIKNLPDGLYRKLQAQTRRERRSVEREVTRLLTEPSSNVSDFPFSISSGSARITGSTSTPRRSLSSSMRRRRNPAGAARRPASCSEPIKKPESKSGRDVSPRSGEDLNDRAPVRCAVRRSYTQIENCV